MAWGGLARSHNGEEVLDNLVPEGCSDRFWVELDAIDGERLVLEPHDLLAVHLFERPRRNLEIWRHGCAIHHQGVIPHGSKGGRKIPEHPRVMV